MTDLEITKLCAEATGYKNISGPQAKRSLVVFNGIHHMVFDPLHDDAQAMQLVKKFGLNITHYYWDDPVVEKIDAHHKEVASAKNADLNRAICECVAKMQQAKQKEVT